MKVLIAAVAEHAWVENGCLSLCKTFDTISSSNFPYALPRLSFALKLLARRSEEGEHKLRVSLSDCDGKKIMNADLNFNIQPSAESVTEVSFSFALNGQNIVFPAPGDYVVDMVVDNRIEASIPIYARQKK